MTYPPSGSAGFEVGFGNPASACGASVAVTAGSLRRAITLLCARSALFALI
jgi:hypothetical protein